MLIEYFRVNAGCVILAAGSSSRLGQIKQLVRLNGETLLDRAVRTASEAGCSPIVVVLGAAAKEIMRECNLDRAESVTNPDWAEGMASSLRTGVAALRGRAHAVLIMTCDQPAVDVPHLRRLATQGEAMATRSTAIASSYAGRKGVPAYFPASMFDLLTALQGDEGARTLLHSAESVPLPDGELDVDTPEALANAKRRYERS